jgi:hypothetical protein
VSRNKLRLTIRRISSSLEEFAQEVMDCLSGQSGEEATMS